MGKLWYIEIGAMTFQSFVILYFAIKNIRLIRNWSLGLLLNENSIINMNQGEERQHAALIA
jgi:hypothetical protein